MAKSKKAAQGLIKSKTFWFNVLTIAVASADMLSGMNCGDPKIYLAVSGIGNIILRVFTSKALEDK